MQNLAESILQVSRIESGSFSLDIQKNVDFHSLVSPVIDDVDKTYAYKEKANRVSILFLPFDNLWNSGNVEITVQRQRQEQKQQVRKQRKKRSSRSNP